MSQPDKCFLLKVRLFSGTILFDRSRVSEEMSARFLREDGRRYQMSILSLASGASVSRGYDYFEEHKVIEWSKTCDGVYHGVVAGSYGARYRVTIDVCHPRKNSECTCPHASGTHRICKHMVALYFTVFPKEAETYYREVIAKGAVSVLEPTTEPWGQRTCYISDPEGNLIEIGSFNKPFRS